MTTKKNLSKSQAETLLGTLGMPSRARRALLGATEMHAPKPQPYPGWEHVGVTFKDGKFTVSWK